MSERIPLHASATSRLVLARMITLPSRSTGTAHAWMAVVPTREASSCSGNAIWLNTIAGSGIISSMNASGQPRTRRCPHPCRKRSAPTIITIMSAASPN